MTADKKTGLEGWTGSADDQNRLFFQARNLAIEALCLRLDLLFLRAGLPVRTEWRESSFPSVSLRLTLTNPKSGQGWTEFSCSILIRRLHIKGPSYLSTCFYEYLGASLDMGPRPAAPIRSLVAEVRTLIETGQLSQLIGEVNYPFDYKHHSSF